MGDEMVRRRAGYSQEVRRDAVSMVLELGMSKDEVCARFGMAKGTLNRWISQVRGTAGQGRGNWKKPAHLRPVPGEDPRDGRIRELEDQVEFLKKAAAFFASLETAQGFEYLATVIDIDTRQVIGMAQAEHMRSDLVIQALANAKNAGYLAPDAIFHSDHGSVYTSAPFAKAAELLQVRLSLGRIGVCWDNAVAESFFATLKREMWSLSSWPTRQGARQAVEQWIRSYYNNFRIHSALGTTPRARHQELTENQQQEQQETKVA